MKAQLQKRQDWIRGRREKRKLARQARLRRQIMRYTLLLVLIAAGICGFMRLPWAISNPVQDVEIHGNQVVTDDQIRSALTAAVGKPLYRLNPDVLQNKICSLAAVKYAFVRRYVFPRPHLSVEVLEEFPWATYCSTPGGPAEGVIAQSGRFIPLSEFPRAVQPPLRICANPGIKLSAGEISQWDGWVKLISAQTGAPVDLVDMRKPTAIELLSGPFDLRIGAADSTLTRRLGRLGSVMPVAANVQDKLKYIDLSLDSNIPLKVDKAATAGNGRLLPEAGNIHTAQQQQPVSPPSPI